ncbi:hypothetical protein HY621_01125 [Candidatus Uhrbacteria bacterium]|nr:hypothetical protein [Candidatus Uhrbacteria bacterium]
MKKVSVHMVSKFFEKYDRTLVEIDGYYRAGILYDKDIDSLEKLHICHGNKDLAKFTMEEALENIGEEEYAGKIRLIATVGGALTSYKNLRWIFKVDLLDDLGNVKKSYQVDRRRIPKYWREKL